ncbi:MAG TPA: hypothetical protein VFI44_04035, partial [Ornithinibacter sp.]|nr:hypothetical protein [Ornithinibacter sp.]
GIIGGLIAVPTIAVLNAVGHHLLDGPESRDDVPPGGAKTPDEVLTPGQEARAEAEAEDVADRTEQAAHDRTPGTD